MSISEESLEEKEFINDVDVIPGFSATSAHSSIHPKDNAL